MSLRRVATKHISAAVLTVCGFAGFAVVPANHATAADSSCTRYAAPSGSDSNSGSSSSPFATVGKLVTSLSAGQTGCLAAGATFTGDVSIYRGGGAGAPITITSTDSSNPATIKGRLVTFSGADWITFTQLRLDGINGSGLPSPTVGSEHVTFSHVDVTNERTAICFDLINSSQWGVARYTTIDSSRIHDCGRRPFGSTNNDHGIYVSGFDATVTNNYIYANADRGVQLRGSQGAVVQHNVIDGNGEGVIFGDLSASNNEVAYNVIANSIVRSNVESWWGTTPVGTGNTAHDNCVWATNTNTSYDANGGITLGSGFTASNNRTANPLYVNAGAGNYALSSGTGCAGYGVQAGVAPGPGTSSPATTPATTTTTTTSTQTASTTSATTAASTTTSATTTTAATTSTTQASPPSTTSSTTTVAATTTTAPPPVATAPPTIAGKAAVGSTLTASPGTWTDAAGYTFTWLRCRASGDGCAPIADASQTSYQLTSADKSARIRVTVIAQNAVGSTTAGSAPTDTVKK